MNRASKILTVSYGTFSCTLEGFDDTLDTMKAIAEYFRDLSANDRYFGAEPPALDPEVLANIASQETNLQVEAKVSDTGVHLTPSGKIPATSESHVPETPVGSKQDSTSKEDKPATLVVPSSEYDDTQDEALVEAVHPLENPVLKQDTSEPGTESIAAKLRRIRAVVAAKQATSSATSIFAEHFQPEQEDDDTDEDEEPVRNAPVKPQGSKPRVTPDKAEEIRIEAPSSELEDDDMKIDLPETDFPLSQGIDDFDDFDQDDDSMSVANILDVVEPEEEEEFKETVSSDGEQETPDSVTPQTGDVTENIIQEPAATEEDSIVRPVRPVRPKSVQSKRPEQPEGGSETTQDNLEADKTDHMAVPDTENIRNAVQGILGKTSLSADDETDLVTQLASIEIKESFSEPAVSIDKGIDAALRADRANRLIGSQGEAKDEAALARLLEETNAKLDTSESHRRQSALSHLRAAVAATFADKKLDLGDEYGDSDGAEPYRTALADVVKPKTANSYVEPDNSGVAPLVLATDQRVDIENIAKDGLAVVESVEKERDNLIANSTSFAEFAREVGATDLPDLMEAAAAYAAYIEGRPHFARPQIMRQVANYAGKDEFNREEGLRSFGQLLRQGKIVKIRRGQFGIADNTRFKPTTMAGE